MPARRRQLRACRLSPNARSGLSGVTGVTADQLLKSSNVSPRLDADLLRFTVDNARPSDAARLATAYASAFTSYKLETDTASLRGARKELEGRLEVPPRRGRNPHPDVCGCIQEGAGRPYARASPSAPSVVRPVRSVDQVQPRPLRSAALGAALGLLLGLGVAALWNALDKRVRSEEEVEEALTCPYSLAYLDTREGSWARLARHARRSSPPCRRICAAHADESRTGRNGRRRQDDHGHECCSEGGQVDDHCEPGRRSLSRRAPGRAR